MSGAREVGPTRNRLYAYQQTGIILIWFYGVRSILNGLLPRGCSARCISGSRHRIFLLASLFLWRRTGMGIVAVKDIGVVEIGTVEIRVLERAWSSPPNFHMEVSRKIRFSPLRQIVQGQLHIPLIPPGVLPEYRITGRYPGRNQSRGKGLSRGIGRRWGRWGKSCCSARKPGGGKRQDCRQEQKERPETFHDVAPLLEIAVGVMMLVYYRFSFKKSHPSRQKLHSLTVENDRHEK